MSEDTNPQGTEAEAAQRIAALEAAEESSEAPETPEEPKEETPEEPEESEEVMPASEQDLPTQEEQSEEEGLPPESSERTKKAFDKLTESNRKLKEQLEKQGTQRGESVYDDLFGPQTPVPQGYEQVTNAQNYQNLDQQQIDNIASQFVYEDPNTGERTVDVERMVVSLQQANQQVVFQAEKRAKDLIERFEQTRQVDDAHTKHPYLDPKNEQFDPVFYDMVRLKVLDNKVHGGNKTLNQLAEDALQVYKPRLDAGKAKQQAVEQYKQSQEVRKQAQPTVRGRGADRAGSAAQQEALRARTQSSNIHESDSALINRLKHAS